MWHWMLQWLTLWTCEQVVFVHVSMRVIACMCLPACGQLALATWALWERCHGNPLVRNLPLCLSLSVFPPHVFSLVFVLTACAYPNMWICNVLKAFWPISVIQWLKLDLLQEQKANWKCFSGKSYSRLGEASHSLLNVILFLGFLAPFGQCKLHHRADVTPKRKMSKKNT